uniref:Thread biopolymer filament subunit gamma-like n=1 Tax=Petromyzon marinus TaxID=7757 RepID=A0AAJ7SL08_PETMA|nr:thread biopolymer filament subunit gamma-like [Petromyzon marinus]
MIMMTMITMTTMIQTMITMTTKMIKPMITMNDDDGDDDNEDAGFGTRPQVRLLQRENAALEAQLKVLAGGAPLTADGDLAVDYEERVAALRSTLETLATEAVSLEVEADNVRASADELRAKYEFETGIRYQLQSDISLMKKDIEFANDSKVTLATKMTSLTEELAFLKINYEEEMTTYHARLGSTESTSAVIELDTVRSVDVTTALSKIRDEYEELARKHRAEAEAYYTSTVEQIQESTVQTTAAITELKTELSTVRKEAQSRYLELQTTLSESYSLEQTVAMSSARSSTSVASYQSTFASLEVAISTAKSDLQRQLVAYQALVDVKLVLDAEIATYKRLLEGEEDILGGVNISPSGVRFSSASPVSSGGGSVVRATSISGSHVATAATAAAAAAVAAVAAAAALPVGLGVSVPVAVEVPVLAPVVAATVTAAAEAVVVTTETFEEVTASSSSSFSEVSSSKVATTSGEELLGTDLATTAAAIAATAE